MNEAESFLERIRDCGHHKTLTDPEVRLLEDVVTVGIRGGSIW